MPDLVRLPGWKPRLAAYLAESAALPFAFGVHDCALFCAGAVEVMTGIDLARDLRGYASEAEGLALVQSRGFANHVDVFEQALPLTYRPIEGDVVTFEAGGAIAIGILNGPAILVAGPQRMGRMPRRAMLAAYHVPLSGAG